MVTWSPCTSVIVEFVPLECLGADLPKILLFQAPAKRAEPDAGPGRTVPGADVGLRVRVQLASLPPPAAEAG